MLVGDIHYSLWYYHNEGGDDITVMMIIFFLLELKAGTVLNIFIDKNKSRFCDFDD